MFTHLPPPVNYFQTSLSCSPVQVNGTLTSVNLSYNNIGDAGAASLGEAFKVTSASECPLF